MREKAMAYFHGVEGFNCCQALLKAFQNSHDVSEQVILDAKRFGGGRAPDNVCGALFALHMMAPNNVNETTDAFRQEVGSHLCREIRGNKLRSCRACVGIAGAIFTDREAN